MVFFMMLKRQSFKNLWEYVGVAELENYLFILEKVWGFHHPTPKVIIYFSGELRYLYWATHNWMCFLAYLKFMFFSPYAIF